MQVQWAAIALRRLANGGLCRCRTRISPLRKELLVGRELTAPSFTHRIRPAAPLFSRLTNLHEAVGHIAKTTPDILTNPEVARALEQALVHAMVSCISGGETAEQQRASSPRGGNAAIGRGAGSQLRSDPVRGGTLRGHGCIRPHPSRLLSGTFGHEPHTVFVAAADASRASSAANGRSRHGGPNVIATDYGFWELGRFSVAYRSLYGETPSASLRRPPDDPRPQKNIGPPWRLPQSA